MLAVGHERVRRPARHQVVGLDHAVAQAGGLEPRRGLLDAAGRAGHQELHVEGIDARGELVGAGDADGVGRRLVVGRAEQHGVDVAHAIGADLGSHLVPDLGEHAFVVDAGERHGVVPAPDHDGAGPELVEHGGGLTRPAVAAAQHDPVPALVGRRGAAARQRGGAVDEGLAAVPDAVVVGVDVGLLQRQQVRAVVLGQLRRRGAGRSRVRRARAGQRWGDVDRGGAHLEHRSRPRPRRRPGMVPRPGRRDGHD